MYDECVSEVKMPRTYSSPVLDEHAARTLYRIYESASELFLEREYARTTIQCIAYRDVVDRDTVHAVFGSKPRVLTALIDQRLVPDGSAASVRERPEALAIKDERDQRKQIDMLAAFLADISTNVRPV